MVQFSQMTIYRYNKWVKLATERNNVYVLNSPQSLILFTWT